MLLFHLSVENQKKKKIQKNPTQHNCVRSCLMANSESQLLFSHTYLSFFARLLAQRPGGFLLNVRYFHISGPSGLASGRCKQTNKRLLGADFQQYKLVADQHRRSHIRTVHLFSNHVTFLNRFSFLKISHFSPRSFFLYW